MTHGSLFSGIGGFDLAAQWMGWENLFHCEWNPFGQKILKHYWPNAASYNDIKNADFTIWRGKIDVLSGGFPCQPYSSAGKRAGTADDRHLWPEMLRCIQECQPRWVVGENVDGIFTWSDGLVFEAVCADLENEGYEVQPLRIPACAKEAPHRRDRWWFVAHSNGHANSPHRGAFREADKVSSIGGKKVAAGVLRGTTGDAPDRPGRNDGRHPREQETRQEPESGNGIKPGTTSDPEKAECKLSGHTRERGDGFTDDHIHAAHPDRKGCERGEQLGTPEQRTGPSRPIAERFENEQWPQAATRLCRMDDGLSGELDGAAVFAGIKRKSNRKPSDKNIIGRWRRESLKGYGNAIVPQIAHEIFQAIQHTENAH